MPLPLSRKAPEKRAYNPPDNLIIANGFVLLLLNDDIFYQTIYLAFN